MNDRKMAWVAAIEEITAIPGADLIVAYRVGGWWVVDKKDAYKLGDYAVYCSIDSWIPHTVAPFLSKGHEPREYNGVKGERLRTIKLKGQISQGLLLPLEGDLPLGYACAELLGIQKWEAPTPVQLAGEIRGLFPSEVPKTDQERVQNLTNELIDWQDLEFEVTEKLDGTSATFFVDLEGELHVCSRNLDLKPSEGNTYWKIAREHRLEKIPKGYAVQGEIIGEGIQCNKYKSYEHKFFVFDIYDVNTGAYLAPKDRMLFCAKYSLFHVHVLPWSSIHGLSVDDILGFAEGKSDLNSATEREGLVFKCKTNPDTHFKAISNKFLLKGGD